MQSYIINIIIAFVGLFSAFIFDDITLTRWAILATLVITTIGLIINLSSKKTNLKTSSTTKIKAHSL